MIFLYRNFKQTLEEFTLSQLEQIESYKFALRAKPSCFLLKNIQLLIIMILWPEPLHIAERYPFVQTFVL